MKKLLVFTTFLTTFIFSIMMFMPYEKIYRVAIDSLAQRGRINISYSIQKASPTYLELKDLKLIMPDKVVNIDNCKIYLHPLGLLLNRDLISIYVYLHDKLGTFNIKRENNKLYINGIFKTSMLSYFLDNRMSNFIKMFKGTDTLNLVLTREKQRIIINKLKITGDFELTARGYIKSGILRLVGVIKIGKIKENFSI